MIRNALEHIQGIAILPIIGLLLFFAVFTGMLIWAIRMRKPYIDHMGNLPLNDGSETPSDVPPPSKPL
ncbi:MAG TPA: cbb3-type cytochrome c oxidase subunit 3 [Kiritimatiellia bacterium]|nr:cbb3-type cytochrome c oxidase subunit 3 [Kiritimatiellia bacterium]